MGRPERLAERILYYVIREMHSNTYALGSNEMCLRLSTREKTRVDSARDTLHRILKEDSNRLFMRGELQLLDHRVVLGTNSRLFWETVRLSFPACRPVEAGTPCDAAFFVPQGKLPGLLLFDSLMAAALDEGGVLSTASSFFAHEASKLSNHLLLHGLSVGLGETGFVVCGPSMSGKSTLFLELCRLGATPYNDDATAVALDGGRLTATGRKFQFRGTSPTEIAAALGSPVERCQDRFGEDHIVDPPAPSPQADSGSKPQARSLFRRSSCQGMPISITRFANYERDSMPHACLAGFRPRSNVRA